MIAIIHFCLYRFLPLCPFFFAGIVLGGGSHAYASDEGYFLAESDHMERSDGSIQIKGLAGTYSPSEAIEISIAILDKSYECGDLYITMQDSTGKTISQNGYFKECFVDDGVDFPPLRHIQRKQTREANIR